MNAQVKSWVCVILTESLNLPTNITVISGLLVLGKKNTGEDGRTLLARELH